jgi:hypothetical protein
MIHAYPYRDLFMLEHARQIRAAVTLPLVLLGGVSNRAGEHRHDRGLRIRRHGSGAAARTGPGEPHPVRALHPVAVHPLATNACPPALAKAPHASSWRGVVQVV